MMNPELKTVQRGVCPYCGIDAMTGPYAHAKHEDCIQAMRNKHIAYRYRIRHFFADRLQHVQSEDYSINLTSEETDKLFRELEAP